jgi:hypothetical protein
MERAQHVTQSDVLNYLIRKGPGRTGLELARAIYVDKAYQQRVNQDTMMAILGRTEMPEPRRSTGSPSRAHACGDRLRPSS